jgi:hypothetical protein
MFKKIIKNKNFLCKERGFYILSLPQLKKNKEFENPNFPNEVVKLTYFVNTVWTKHFVILQKS